MEKSDEGAAARVPWNKGKLTGQKSPLKLKEIWAIRIRLQLSARISPHKESAGGAATAWPYEAGEHSAIPRH